ncbi:MAG: hypothetical protein HMLKMBBP_02180 [Planctomycetes bacterium]|nr:hypothetical protein [Planctomycetota bacterium]
MTRRLAAAALSAALSAGLGACVAVPYPREPEILPSRLAPHVGADRDVAGAFTVGSTTREEVLLRIGEPDRTKDGGRVLLWLGRELRMGLAYAVLVPGLGAGVLPDERTPGAFVALALAFDDRGVLVRRAEPREPRVSVTSGAFFDELEAWR